MRELMRLKARRGALIYGPFIVAVRCCYLPVSFCCASEHFRWPATGSTGGSTVVLAYRPSLGGCVGKIGCIFSHRPLGFFFYYYFAGELTRHCGAGDDG